MKIIADIGSNWRRMGDLLLAADMAKFCDVDVFKIQYFSQNDLFGYSDSNDKRLLHKAAIKVEELAEHCQRLGLEFMASVFNEDDVNFMNQYVQRFKVASGEAKHYKLLKQIAKTGKPIIVSTGCYDNFNYLLEIFDPDLVTLFYCVAEYPARSTDWRVLIDMIANSPFKIGFSDHSYDLVASAETAREYGCTLFERHFNPSYMSPIESPDSGPHALNPSEMAYYCRYLKQKETLSFPEKNKVFRRRPIAIEPIECGDKLKYDENWSFLRPRKLEIDDNLNWDFDTNKNIIALNDIEVGETLNWSNCGICPSQPETE